MVGQEERGTSSFRWFRDMVDFLLEDYWETDDFFRLACERAVAFLAQRRLWRLWDGLAPWCGLLPCVPQQGRCRVFCTNRLIELCDRASRWWRCDDVCVNLASLRRSLLVLLFFFLVCFNVTDASVTSEKWWLDCVGGSCRCYLKYCTYSSWISCSNPSFHSNSGPLTPPHSLVFWVWTLCPRGNKYGAGLSLPDVSLDDWCASSCYKLLSLLLLSVVISICPKIYAFGPSLSIQLWIWIYE